MNKKVLFVTPSYYPSLGGVEKHVNKISQSLLSRVNVEILTICTDSNLSCNEVIDGVIVKRKKIIKARGINMLILPLFSLRNVRYFLKQDIIHAHDWLMFYYIILPILPLLKLKGIKIHITFHGWEGVFPPKRKAIFFRWIAELCTNKSIAIGEFIPKWYRMIKKPIIIYGGCSDEIQIDSYKDSNLFIFVGRLENDSGIKYALEHFLKLQRSNEDFRLVVLGDGSLLRNLQLNFDDEQTIEFLGNKNSRVVTDFMRRAQFCYTSGYLGIIEAMFARCQVISSFSNDLKKDYLEFFKKRFDLPILIEDELNPSYELPRVCSFDFSKLENEFSWNSVGKVYLELWKI